MKQTWRIWWPFSRQRLFGWRPTVATATLGFVVIVCGVIMGLEASRILEQRAQALARGQRDTANLVMSLMQQAELTFRSADNVVAGLVLSSWTNRP